MPTIADLLAEEPQQSTVGDLIQQDQSTSVGDLIEGAQAPKPPMPAAEAPAPELLPGGGFAATTGDVQTDAQAAEGPGVGRALIKAPQHVKLGTEAQAAQFAEMAGNKQLDELDKVIDAFKQIKVGAPPPPSELAKIRDTSYGYLLSEALNAKDAVGMAKIEDQLTQARTQLAATAAARGEKAASLEADLAKINPPDQTFLEKAVAGTLESAGPTVAGLALAPVTGGATAAVVGGALGVAGQAGSSYADIKQKEKETGVTYPEERRFGMAMGQGLLEGIGEGAELRIFTKAGLPAFQRLINDVVGGMSSEAITQLFQSATAKATYDPNMTLQDFLEQEGLATVGGGLMGATAAGVTHTAEKVAGAVEEHQRMAKIADLLDTSEEPDIQQAAAAKFAGPQVTISQPLEDPQSRLIRSVKKGDWKTAMAAGEEVSAGGDQPVIVLGRAAQRGDLNSQQLADFRQAFIEHQLVRQVEAKGPEILDLGDEAKQIEKQILASDEAKSYTPTEAELQERQLAEQLTSRYGQKGKVTQAELADFVTQLPDTPLGNAYAKMVREKLVGTPPEEPGRSFWSPDDRVDFQTATRRYQSDPLGRLIAYYNILAARQAAGFYPFAATAARSFSQQKYASDYSTLDGHTTTDYDQKPGTAVYRTSDQQLGQRLASILQEWIQRISPTAKLRIIDESVVPQIKGHLGFMDATAPGEAAIAINAKDLVGLGEDKLVETLAHEYGHFLMRNYLQAMPEKVAAAVWRAWARETKQLSMMNGEQALAARRGPAAQPLFNPGTKPLTARWGDAFYRSYLYGFEEWAAHGMERMLASDKMQMNSLAQRFIKGLTAIYKKFHESGKNDWNPNQTFEQFIHLGRIYDQQKALAHEAAAKTAEAMKKWGFELHDFEASEMREVAQEIAKALDRTGATQQLRDAMQEAPPEMQRRALKAIENIGLHEAYLLTPQPESGVVYSAEEFTNMLEDSWLPGQPQNPSLIALNTLPPGIVGSQAIPANQGMPQSKAASRSLSLLKNMLKYSKTYRGRNFRDLSGYQGHLDRYSWWMKWTYSLLHMARVNPHIDHLQAYVGKVREWASARMQWMSRADQRLKEWSSLSKSDQKILGEFMLDQTTGGKFLDRNDANIRRKYPMSDYAWGMYDKINSDFTDFLTAVEGTLLNTAAKHLSKNPFAAAAEMQRIRKRFADLKQRPYFPLSRFGKHVLSVHATKDTQIAGKTYKAGELMHFEAFDTEFALLAEHDRIQGMYPTGELKKTLLDENTSALMGMPAMVLEAVKSNPDIGLTDVQKKALDEYIYKLAPGQSFVKHLMERRAIAGYTTDVRRAYADYFMHGANHLGRLMYATELNDLIRSTKVTAQLIEADSTKRMAIVNAMSRHFDFIMRPENDWAALRGGVAIAYLGLLPKSAFVNLTQVPLFSYPYLASKHGDVKAIAAITAAYKDAIAAYHVTKVLTQEEEAAITKWAQGGQLTPAEEKIVSQWSKLSAGERSMLRQGAQEGWLDESIAMELAALSEGSWLTRFKATSQLGYYGRRVSQIAMIPFQAVEKLNRRSTALAAFRLSKKAGAADREAISAARDAVTATQFEYAKWNRPELLRGKRGVIFMFWQYMMSALNFAFTKSNWRFWGALFAAAGWEGLPFAQDLMDLMTWLLSSDTKRVNLRYESKKLSEQLGEMLSIPGDLLQHGVSRYGFGIIPWADLSGSLSMGHVVPGANMAGAAGTGKSWNDMLAMGVQEGGGATVGLAMRMLQAMTSDDPDTLRRVQKGIPLNFAQQILGAWQLYRDGGYQNMAGATTVKMDTDDPWDLAQIAFKALGFQPRSVNQQREETMLQNDFAKYFATRSMLLRNKLDQELQHGDRESVQGVIEAIRQYNKEAPPPMRITGKEIVQSQRAHAKTRALQERDMAIQRSQSAVMQMVKKRQF